MIFVLIILSWRSLGRIRFFLDPSPSAQGDRREKTFDFHNRICENATLDTIDNQWSQIKA